MLQENEVVTLLLGVGTMIFILAHRPRLGQLPYSKIILSAFYIIFAGWAFTVFETFIWSNVLNFLEHACYAASSLLLAVWCWKVVRGRREGS